MTFSEHRRPPRSPGRPYMRRNNSPYDWNQFPKPLSSVYRVGQNNDRYNRSVYRQDVGQFNVQPNFKSIQHPFVGSSKLYIDYTGINILAVGCRIIDTNFTTRSTEQRIDRMCANLKFNSISYLIALPASDYIV